MVERKGQFLGWCLKKLVFSNSVRGTFWKPWDLSAGEVMCRCWAKPSCWGSYQGAQCLRSSWTLQTVSLTPESPQLTSGHNAYPFTIGWLAPSQPMRLSFDVSSSRILPWLSSIGLYKNPILWSNHFPFPLPPAPSILIYWFRIFQISSITQYGTSHVWLLSLRVTFFFFFF